MKVLLLVDIQNDFCPNGSLPVGEGDKIVPVVNRLMREGGYDLIASSLDWHPPNHISFITQHPGMQLFQTVQTANGEQRVWPVHCVQGTNGAELHPDIDVTRIHHFIKKGESAEIDSYSAFFDNGKKSETQLRNILDMALRERGESYADVELTVVGLALDVCVAATVRDAVGLGISTEVVLDACRAVDTDPASELALLREFTSLGVSVVLSREILPDVGRAVEIQQTMQP